LSPEGTDRRAAGIIRFREPRLGKQLLQGNPKPDTEQTSTAPELGSKAPQRKIQAIHVGGRGNLGRGPCASLRLFSGADGANPSSLRIKETATGTQPVPAFRKNAADIIDGKIPFSASDDRIPARSALGTPGALSVGQEKGRLGFWRKLMGEDPEASGE